MTRSLLNTTAVMLAVLTVAVPVSAQTQFDPQGFSILARNSVWLKKGSVTVNGKVGVNEATGGPFLNSSSALVVGKSAQVLGAAALLADSTKVKGNAVVDGTIFFNTLTNNGTLNGAQNSPLALPLVPSLPPFNAGTPGTTDIVVQKNQTRTLAAGDYGGITVKKGGTLIFTGGLYQIKLIDARVNTKLLFRAASEVRVKESARTKSNSTVGADAGANLTASDILFHVEGADTLSELPVVKIGVNNNVLGHFYAPHGTIWLKRGSNARGAFFANNVKMGNFTNITLDEGLPPGTNRLSGRVLDASDAALGATTPVVGAAVSLLGTAFTTTTDINGNFTLSGIDVGAPVLDIDALNASPAPDGSLYASFREEIVIAAGANVVERPFFLPRIDASSLTTIDPAQNTVVTNSNLNVSLTVLADSAKNQDGTDFTGQISISEVPRGFAPAELPEAIDPGLLITIQPVGLSFDPPAQLTFPNLDQLEANTQTHLWSLDPETGRFAVVGMGEVRADGTAIDTVSGGIPASDWHTVLDTPRVPLGGEFDLNNDSNQDREMEEECEVGSVSVLHKGSLSVEHATASHRSFGISRSLRFVYNSLNADPQPILTSATSIASLSSLPVTFSASLRVDGAPQGNEVFMSSAGMDPDADETLRQALQFDASGFATGRYPYRISLADNYLFSRVLNFQFGNVLVNNQIDSPFGAGWGLDGLQRVHEQEDNSIVLTQGDGSIKVFQTERTGTGTFVNPVLAGGDGATGVIQKPADFNNDGVQDLAVGGITTGDIAILLNDGQGNFTLTSTTPAGPQGFRFISGDFNNDDNIDLIAANESVDTITLLLGDGTGGILSTSAFPSGNGARALAAGDFNGDNNLDVAVSNSAAGSVGIHLGDGAGGFSALQSETATGDFPSSIFAVDVNNDDNLDILVLNITGKSTSTLFGDGNGGFSSPATFPVGGVSISQINVGDFNADGFPDLALGDTSSTQNRFIVRRGDGTGLFQTNISLTQAGKPGSIAIDDINGDDHLDVLLFLSDNGSVAVFIGDGTGFFPLPAVIAVNEFSTTGLPLQIGDFNGDTVTDIIGKDALDETKIKILFGESTGESPLGDFSTLQKNPDGSFVRNLKDGTEIHFDASGLHTSTVDRNGNATTFGYDVSGLLTSITDPAGLITTLTYSNGKLSSVTDPASRVTQFTHDANGNLTRITDPDNTVRRFDYDARHRMTSQTGKRNVVTTYEYNFAGRLVQSSLPDGTTREATPSQVVGLVDPASGLGTQGNPAPFVRPDEVFATFTDGNGEVAQFILDKFGSATVAVDPLGRQTDTVRDENGNPLTVMQPNGALRTSLFDAMGNLISSTDSSNGAVSQFTHDPVFNRLTSFTDAEDNAYLFNLDAAGNLIEVIDPENTKTTLTYGEPACPGMSTQLTLGAGLPEANTFTRTLDAATCNVASRLNPLGDGKVFEFDAAGNITKSVDALMRESRFTYDAMNRLVKSIDPSNALPDPACGTAGVTCFDYDAAGNTAQVTDAKGQTFSFEYDAVGRLAKEIDPLMRETLFVYDGNGNLRFITDRKGQVREFVYDAAGQLVQKILQPGTPDAAITAYQYDLFGRVISAADPDSAVTSTFDPLGRMLTTSTLGSASQPSVTLAFTHDLNGNRLTLNDGLTGTTQYIYNSLNQPESVTHASGSGAAFAYDAVHRRTQTAYSNGTTAVRQFNAASQVTAIDHQLGASVFSSFGYSYDAFENLDGATLDRTAAGISKTLSYGYDALNRLNQATRPETGLPDETFGYDAVGNRLTRDGQMGNSIFDGANRLLEDGLFTYSYDNNGNRTSRTDKGSGAVTEYAYDADDRLIRIEEKPDAVSPPTQTTTYRYDGFGRRIQKDVDGVVTSYIYDGKNIVLEFDGGGSLLARYSHGLDVDEPLVMERGGMAYFYHRDALGSVTELTDSTGTVAQAYVYDAYGGIQATSLLENPFTFTGREFDTESGLYYYRARYYDPAAGRFVNEDPIGLEGGINVYAYVGNNPVNFTDPDGLLDVSNLRPELSDIVNTLGIGTLLFACKQCVDPLAEQVDALGERDTLEHCFVGAMARQKCGLHCAEAAAFGKEVLDYFGEGTSEFRDIQNTFEGFKCSEVSSCIPDLEECCENQNLTEGPGNN